MHLNQGRSSKWGAQESPRELRLRPRAGLRHLQRADGEGTPGVTAHPSTRALPASFAPAYMALPVHCSRKLYQITPYSFTGSGHACA